VGVSYDLKDIDRQRAQIRAQQAQLEAQQAQIKAQQLTALVEQGQIAQLTSQLRSVQATLKGNNRIIEAFF
jgi:multidrug resistance efflux pump